MDWFRSRPLVSGLICLAAVSARPVVAQSVAPSEPPPSNPAAPYGVIPLPPNVPPTGRQSAVPAPALPIPKPDRPRLASPGTQMLGLLVKDHPISIEEAIGIALSTNRDLAFAGASLLAAQGRTAEARSALNPTVGVSNASYNYLHQQIQPAAVVGATLPIDIAGLLRAATDEARFQEIGYRLDVNRIRNQVVGDVKAAFYDLLRAQALERVANENLQNALFNLSEAEKKLEARTVTRFDVIRAQTIVAAAQQAVIAAHNTARRGVGLLNNAIGIDIQIPLQVKEGDAVETPPGVVPPPGPPNAPAAGQAPPPLPPTVQSPTANPPTGPSVAPPMAQDRKPEIPEDLGPEFQSVLKESLDTRPEIMEAQANIEAARRGVYVARRSLLPTADVSGGYFDERNFTGTTRVEEPRVFVNLTLPLYDGGLAHARAVQARAAAATAETNHRQAVDLVNLDVQQAYLNLVQARDQVVVADQALVGARAGYELALVRYNAGVSARAGISPLLELSDAQAALTGAESSQVNALYDYNNARAQLDRSVGRFAFVQNGSGYAAPPPALAKSDASPRR